MRKLTEIIRQETPALVVFIHAAKGPQDAVEIKYLTEELRKNYGDRANIVRVDCSYNGNIKEHYKLAEYPTWILFSKGEELMRESGRKNLADLEQMLKTVLP